MVLVCFFFCFFSPHFGIQTAVVLRFSSRNCFVSNGEMPEVKKKKKRREKNNANANYFGRGRIRVVCIVIMFRQPFGRFLLPFRNVCYVIRSYANSPFSARHVDSSRKVHISKLKVKQLDATFFQRVDEMKKKKLTP